MSILKVVGMVTVGAYAASIIVNGRRKTHAFVCAIPAAIACLPELILRHVENNGPYPEPQNIFRNRPEPQGNGDPAI